MTRQHRRSIPRATATVATLALAAYITAWAQTPAAPPRDSSQGLPAAATGTAVIRGRVIRADNGQPIGRARVTANGPTARSATTDGNGEYELKDLPAGSYSISVSRNGFLTLFYGQRHPFQVGRTPVVATGEALGHIDFRLPRAGAITGQVVDEGEPVTGASVSAFRYQFRNGVRTLVFVARAANPTDDLGQFRIGGLAPGEYYVIASAGSSPGLELDASYLPSYYPGTASIGEAQRLAVGVAQEVSGLSFPVVRGRLATISGLVVRNEGTPVTSGLVSLTQYDLEGSGLTRSRPVSDNRFEFFDLPPGSYRLRATLDSPAGQEMAVVAVMLTGADATVRLPLAKAVKLRGRVVLDPAPPPGSAGLSGLRVAAESPDGMQNLWSPLLPLRSDLTFEGSGPPGWRSLLRVTTPDGWTTSRITAGGRNVTDTPLNLVADITDIEIVLTNRVTTVSGLVRDGRGNAATEAVVVVFADDSQKWGPHTRFVRIGRLDQTGRFIVRGLPAGRYRAVALESLENGAEGDPELLARLRERGALVVLADAESRALDLTVVDGQ